MDDDEYPSFKKQEAAPEEQQAAAPVVTEEAAADAEAVEDQQAVVELPAVDIVKEDTATATDAVADVEPPKMMMASRPSFKWSTPTGARIGCHQNYQGDVKSMALEQVNLLPRRWLWRRRLASPQPQDQAVAQPPEWIAAGGSRAAARARRGERPAGGGAGFCWASPTRRATGRLKDFAI